MTTQYAISVSGRISKVVNVAYAAQAIQNDVLNSTTISTNQVVMTLEMVQHMFLTAFSTLRLQGQSKIASSTRLADSGASNHMTSSLDFLQNLVQYNGRQNNQIANGGSIPIPTIGDIGHSFHHVFIAPKLSGSLISIGQVVENNCDVHLSRGGCLVQDQV